MHSVIALPNEICIQHIPLIVSFLMNTNSGTSGTSNVQQVVEHIKNATTQNIPLMYWSMI